MSSALRRTLLELARDYAGGVSFLARKLGVSYHSLDGMMNGSEEVPEWVFLRAIDYVHERQEEGTPPPGFPPDWQDKLSEDDPAR